MKLLTRMINFLPHDAWQKIGIGVIISCTLILEICSYNNLHYYSNWHAITVEIVWIVICLCIAIWPRKASFIVLIWIPLVIVAPNINYSSMMLTILICLAIAVITQPWYTVLASCGVSSWFFIICDFQNAYVLGWWLLITLISSAIVKYYISTIHQQQEQLFAQRYNVFQKYATIAAIRMHDEVTNELSSIMMMAQQSIEPQTTHDQEHENSREILQRATTAVHRARNIISLLDNATTASTGDAMQSTTCYKDFCTGLRVLFDGEQKSFEKLGYIGSIDLNSDLVAEDSRSAHLPFEECAQIEYICRELLANVKKHAAKPKEYAMNVMLNDHECHITCINSAQRGILANLQLGYGLRFHKMLAERAGGTFKVIEDDDSWIINVHVPLHVEK